MEYPKKEKTLLILKPDALQRSLIGEIIKRIEKTGLKLIFVKMLIAKKEQCFAHYGLKGLSQNIVDRVVKFMTCGPIIVMVWEGNQAVNIAKKIIGSMEPLSSDVGTIRGDFTLDSYQLSNYDSRAVRNLVHCSDEVEEAKREIDLWFNPEEIVSYRLVAEHILYDVDLDGIKE
jgi:nucleoside-diphosphate kinase